MKKLLAILLLMLIPLAAKADNGEFDYSELHPYLIDITGIAPTDSYFIVGDGSNWIREASNTARTSLGLGTSDAVRFDGGVGVGADPTAGVPIWLSGSRSTSIDCLIDNTGIGDAQFEVLLGGVVKWKWGVDNSDGDKWKLSAGISGDLGDNVAIAVDSNLDIAFVGNFTGVGTIAGGAYNGITLNPTVDWLQIYANAAADYWAVQGYNWIQGNADGFEIVGSAVVNTNVRTLTVTGGDWTLDQSVASGAAPTFNNLKIEGGIPILVFKDNTDTGDSARGFQEWRDSNNVRLGYFGNSSYTHDDLVWTNESSGGHLLLYTTGTGKVGINTANPSATLDVAGTLGCGEVTVADGGSINLQEALTFLGATTENLIEMPDNLAVALAIKEAGNSYLTFVTTNGGEKIAFDTIALVVDAANDRVGIRTASPAYPLQIFSDASNLISEVDGLYLDYYADASAAGGTKIAGYFNCKPTGTMGATTTFYGLSGFCFPTDGSFDNNAHTTTLIGLDYKVNLGNDFTGKNRGNSLITKGLIIASYGGSAGYAVGTGTGDDLDVEMINYGGQIVAYLDGTHATPNTGYNYGLHIETNDSLDAEPAAAINSYALYLVSMANTNLNGGESWGIYSASDVVNAIHGKLRIGSVVAPTVALDVTGAALISTTLGVTGVATLGDSSQMATSAAPTADADIANKKYVDDTATAYTSATGSYTGDGTTSKGITGVGFSPKYVRVFQQETTDGLNVEIFSTTPEIMDDNANGGCVWLASGLTRFVDNAIISLDADGFTVDDDGVDAHPNTDGVVYNYICMR